MSSQHHYRGDIQKYLSKNQDKKIPCPLCDRFDDYVLAKQGFPGVPVRNVICRRCGLIRITPRMSDHDYEKFYESDFFEYLNPYARPAYVEEIEYTTDESYETPTKKRLIPFLRDWVPSGGRVLDVGAGFGQILYLLKKEKNISYIGLEPDPYSRKIAQARIGVDLKNETVESFLTRNKEQFDFIVLDQTYEHLLYPLETLQGLAKILKPEGVIFIGVPGTMNPLIPMNLFFQIAHTFNYTSHTFDLLAKRAGLKLIKVRDPRGYPLEVLLAKAESSYSEAPESERQVGSDWREIVRIYRRKKFLNLFRGAVKRALRAVVGEKATEKIRSGFDRTIRYKY